MMRIEVAYALPERQKIAVLEVEEGTSVREAALRSGLDRDFEGLDLTNARLGIFGKLVAKPEQEQVREGDRVEIYRPLIADPKQSRAKRAEKKEQG
ncbi:RnfH family protein [Marinospirillum sp. MEB164]|uniref:UPF0125 protein V6U78_04235 n=1 Tax=Marinospirillum alkalitolerans TaxID=3123374 RepID=A0ABW8PXZ7_9GAMM